MFGMTGVAQITRPLMPSEMAEELHGRPDSAYFVWFNGLAGRLGADVLLVCDA